MASRTRVVLLIGLAVVLRLLAVASVGHRELLRGQFELKNDESTYHLPAVALLTEGCYCWAPGGHPTAYRPPGIVLPLAALYMLITPAPAVALGYVLLCSIAVVLVVRRLAIATLQAERVADVATLIAACLPTLLWTSSGIWSDLPALLFTLLTLWALLRAREGSWKWIVIGACAALSYLNRPSVVFLLPVLFGAAFVADRSRRWRNVALLAITLGLPIGAWGLRNRVVLGSFFTGATVAGSTLWESNNPLTAGLSLPAKQFNDGVDLWIEARAGRYLGSWVPAEYVPGSETVDVRSLSEMEAYQRYVDLTTSFVRQHPSAVGRLVAFKLWRLFSAEPVAASISGDLGMVASVKRASTVAERWFVLVFATIGMWRLYRTRAASRHYYLLFAAASLASVLVAYVNARLLLPFTGVLLVPAAVGVVQVWERLRQRFGSGQIPSTSLS
jgi:4-amino-4-deoxy-L-arabinose transferase-like glycosyltransferase